MIKHRIHFSPFATLFIVAMLWGINFTAMKIGFISLQPMVYNSSRLLIATLICWVLVFLAKAYKPVDPTDIKRILLTSFFGFALPQIALTFGADMTTAGNCSVIMAMIPLSVLLINQVCRTEAIARRGVIGIIISFFGVAMIILSSESGLQVSREDLAGILILIGSQFGTAYYTVYSRRLVEKYSPYQVIAYTMTISLLVFVILSWSSLTQSHWGQVPLSGWISIAFSGIFALAVCNFIWVWAIREIGSNSTAVFNNLPPVFAILSGIIFLHEAFGMLQIIGAIIVLLGVNISHEQIKGIPIPNSANN